MNTVYSVLAGTVVAGCVSVILFLTATSIKQRGSFRWHTLVLLLVMGGIIGCVFWMLRSPIPASDALVAEHTSNQFLSADALEAFTADERSAVGNMKDGVADIRPKSVATNTALIEPTSTASTFAASFVPSLVEGTPTSASLSATGLSKSVIVSDSFDDPNSGWLSRTQETWSVRYVNGHYEMTLSGRPYLGMSTAFAEHDYRLSADITLLEGRAGLIFLSTAPATFYRLMFASDGSYAVEAQTQGAVPIIVMGGTTHPALEVGVGARNYITIERHGATIQFFVNDQLLADFAVPDGDTRNHYGFAVASPSGRAKVLINSIVGEQLSG